MPRPLRIGLSPRILHNPPPELGFRNKTLQYLEQTVAHWIMRRGALVFMLPAIETGGVERSKVRISDYVREIDGLVLQGGADVSPVSYGETPVRPEWSGDRVRDLYEMELFWECVVQSKPVLGICRGLQLINVALGGTLYQDIVTENPDAMAHVDADLYDQHRHTVLIEENSRLAKLYGDQHQHLVNSIHHQAIKRLGRDSVVEAVSASDGIIEAIRMRGQSYVTGFQWHPEFHGLGSELLDSGPILDDFLAAAEKQRK
ncbi:gamma-glutamyl-gamma-aminobutyrate hydrolase family protein [Nitrosospira sp. Is2]|uniref:gamma-glutamyl-gamma-aminobutyrate hydrolase family protein n=1 Tax=Nitrosospira sp. Is2 TaxID=3080532 RepID=UPI002955BCC8|nr:gamma-glutamyl-gamma-aminobutyrate hydrolase family protein [Nitrosospira sp. Is2]WON73927.1 gamma-glutamyl-gamma-aminobutyrate hydrolase family protein [Nitrosospira sp. Is2]